MKQSQTNETNKKKPAQKQSRRCKDTNNKVTTYKNQGGIPSLAVFFTFCWAGVIIK